MKRVLFFILCISLLTSCGQECYVEDLCEELTCVATMGAKVQDALGYTIVGAEVYAIDATGHFFGHCVTTPGGKNHSDETGIHWYDGCDLTELPLDTLISINVMVNGIPSFAEGELYLNSIVDPPHFAVIVNLEEGQY